MLHGGETGVMVTLTCSVLLRNGPNEALWNNTGVTPSRGDPWSFTCPKKPPDTCRECSTRGAARTCEFWRRDDARSEAENLPKALKAERDARKQYEREVKETKAHLEKFAEIKPEEYTKLQQEAAEAARPQAQGEAREAIEQKYSVQAQDAARRPRPPRRSLPTRSSTLWRKSSLPLAVVLTPLMACPSSI